MPDFKPPPFHTNLNNRTIEFNEMISDLGASIVLVPIIAVLGNVAIAKAFSTGQIIDATQELFTLSMCNVIGSFFSSMPITGSFSRSAVNHASGVQTAGGGILTGLMVLLALSFLTPYFAFIPKASLAAVIISAVIFMIEYEVLKPMWRSSKKDLVSAFATFIFCLIIGVEFGILIGVAINIVFLLYPSARPSVHVDKAKVSGLKCTRVEFKFFSGFSDKFRSGLRHYNAWKQPLLPRRRFYKDKYRKDWNYIEKSSYCDRLPFYFR